MIALGLSACSTTTYMHTSGTGVQRGGGGAYLVVNGTELYQEGAPSRPYQVIGVITDSRPAGPWTLGPRASTVAHLAMQNGGQAVIQQSDVRRFVGYSTSNNANWNQYQSNNGNCHNRNSFNYGNASGNSTTTALFNADSRFLVIRYR
jgi:hypothetical protein